MLELTIKDTVYQFNFGMGFMREINKRIGTPVEGLKDVKKNIGLQYMVAGIIDGDLEALSEVLLVANQGQNPRVTSKLIDEYIDSEDTDIDHLLDQVLDFLKSANATKKTVATLLEAIEREKEKAAAK